MAIGVNRELIEIHWHSNVKVYTESHTYQRGQTVSPEAFPDVVLAVDDILG